MIVVQRGTRIVAPPAASRTTHGGYLTLTPVTNPDATVRLEMLGAFTREGGQAEYDEVDRPRRQTALDYTGVSAEVQTGAVVFRGATPAGQEPESVQPGIAALRALTRPLPGQTRPPVLNIDGPVWGRRGAQQWILRSATPRADDRRRSSDGYVWYAEFDLTLVEYIPIDVVVRTAAPPAASSPAAQVNATVDAGQPAGSGRTYTVVRGDNLSRIAQQQLGNPNRWREIAQLNGLSNPNLIRPGQVIRLP